MICMHVLIIIENFFLSETSRSTLDYILIDRSDQDLLNEKKVSNEKVHAWVCLSKNLELRDVIGYNI